MRQKNLYVLSFLFVFLGISLFACGKAETSPPTVASSPTDQPIILPFAVPGHTEVVSPTPFSVLPPTPASTSVGTSSETTLFFLWDDSQSILDAEYCGGTNSDYRVELPHFFVNLMSETNAEGIKIGAGRMMDVFERLSVPQAPNLLMNFPWAQYRENPLEQLSSDTSYEESLSNVGNLLNGVKADQKILVFLTDGFISSKKTTETQKAIENLVDQKIQTYVMLLCPNKLEDKKKDDFEFWTRTIATKEGITVEQSGDPNRWAEILINALHSYLPKEGVWVRNGLSLENYPVDGDAVSINETWLPLFGNTSGEAKLKVDDMAYTVLPFQNIPLQWKPGCGPFSLSASVQGNTSGFLMIKPVLPELKMDFSDAVIEDNNDVEFEINIRATNISYSQLTDRLACYTLDATLEPDSARWGSRVEITTQPQIHNNGNGNYLQAIGKVTDLSYEGPGEIGVWVRLVKTGKDQAATISNFFVIPIQFRTVIPDGSQQKGQIIREYSNNEKFNVKKYSFDVHYDLGSDVVIEMETNLPLQKLNNGTKGLQQEGGDSKWYCPKPDDNKRVKLATDVDDLDANNFASYVRSNYNAKTLKAQFDIYAYQFLSDVCGYRTYYFSWPGNSEYGIIGSRFKCTLQRNDHFECEDITQEMTHE